VKKISANENTFQCIVEKYSNLLVNHAYAICGNKSDAEDIVQEVFVKYLKKKPKFESEEHMKAWLIRVTINLAKNYKNTFWNRKRENLEDIYESKSPIEEKIWDIVKKLPDKYRIVIDLYYREGYSIKEISNILKKSPSTIGTQLERGRKKLKKMLEENIDEGI
jgi:RNA polymerase sigma-70 factor (ECF subfamily)